MTRPRLSLRDFSIPLALLAVIAFFAVAAPEFLSARNLSNLMVELSITATLAMGMLLIILPGHIDLSAGSGVGYAARLSPAVQLLPEVTVLVPVVVTAAADGDSATETVDQAGVLFQAGLSVLIGRKGDAGP